ncbi:MAG: chorismate-binding protein, partial [Acidimicrobiales bacterium]
MAGDLDPTPGPGTAQIPLAVVGGRLATDLVDLTDDLAALDSEGFWAVVLPFEGAPICARFATVRPARPWPGPPWKGPLPDTWTSSLSDQEFMAGVRSIRASIAAGDVYQVNLTRRLSAPLPPGADVAALGAALAEGNPSPYSAVVRIPVAGCHVASASPERFLRVEGGEVETRPIKGTRPRGATPEEDRRLAADLLASAK